MPMLRYVKGVVKKATNDQTRQLVICREKGEVEERKNPLDDDEDRDEEDRDDDSDSSRAD
jgi:hypothetical protein